MTPAPAAAGGPGLDTGHDLGPGGGRFVDGQGDQLVLAALGQGVGRGALVPGPRPGGAQERGDSDVLVHEAGTEERVAVDHLAVEGDVLGVVAFKAQVVPEL